ncbi:hypothetical protein [Legionella quateirensis]|uniref:Uncharacterized protein n=1 Tax=Legionella quateirensis TaxID=45072 RepID=A0A378KTA2_9GAMM|nr:hypothetical protein [Legionella quateirensis]KTD50941.1 hypothetical protein Lqua_1168 [Legionella quateirensis]STY17813.1 Uncharacterised protein [Legionella quateirensis]
MPNLLNDEKAAAKARYEEFLNAVIAMNARNANMKFIISPNQSLFTRMHQNNSICPLHLEFKSHNTGATFTVDNKFFPSSWLLTVPKNATKEEMDCMRDIILETIAHPVGAHKDYEPKMIICFPEDTPEEEIIQFVETAQAKGIEVHLYIGKPADFEKISLDHQKLSQELVAAGDIDKVPGWPGLLNTVSNTEGGRKGEEMMERINSEQSISLRC